MKPYRFLTPANRDLVDILIYLRSNSASAASRFLFRLEDQLKLIALFPQSGYRRESARRPEMRHVLVDDYVVTYDPQTKPIEVVAIQHGSMETDHKTSSD